MSEAFTNLIKSPKEHVLDVLTLSVKVVAKDPKHLFKSVLAGFIIGIAALVASSQPNSALGAVVVVFLYVVSVVISLLLYRPLSESVKMLHELSEKIWGNPAQTAVVKAGSKAYFSLFAFLTACLVSTGNGAFFALAVCVAAFLPECVEVISKMGFEAKGVMLPRHFAIRWLKTPFRVALDEFESLAHELCRVLNRMPSVRWAKIVQARVKLDDENRLLKEVTFCLTLSAFPSFPGEVKMRVVEDEPYKLEGSVFLDVVPYSKSKVSEQVLLEVSKEFVECFALGMQKVLHPQDNLLEPARIFTSPGGVARQA